MGVRATFAVVGVMAAAACGGQSLDQGTDSGGSAGATGGGGTGGSPLGGASGSAASGGSGQAARGGTGGGGAGASGIGGSVLTGGAVGMAGAGRGGAGTAGSGGSVGTSGSGPVAGGSGGPSEECSLPPEVGECDAAIPRFAFNPKTGRCEQFTYGGCGGTANNFSTFEECVAACGPGDESDCPEAQPATGTACTGPDHPCDYSGSTGCLCQPTGQYSCEPLTPATSCFSTRLLPPAGGAGANGECTGPDCPQAIVVISYYTCTCDGQWSCLVTTTGGGAR